MAQEEEGWPLGLQPLNARVGLVRNRHRNGSISFSTLLTGSPTSTIDSSSDHDTESTGSYFREKSITLGSLIGVSSILDLSRRSMRGRPAETPRGKKSCKSKPWLFSLCSKLSTDVVRMNNTNTPSLGHLLEMERRAAGIYKRNHSPPTYGTDDSSNVVPISDPNSLFAGGHVVDPQSSSWLNSNGGRRSNRDLLEHCDDGYGASLLFSCLCGQLTH